MARPRFSARTRPSAIRAEMIRRVVSLTGTAKPRPTPATAGVDADHARLRVGQRAAGVARVQRRVGLDDVLDHPRGRAARVGSDRPTALTAPAVTLPSARAGYRPTRLADHAAGPPRRASAGGGVARSLAAPRGRTAGRRLRPGTAPAVPSENSAVPPFAWPTTCALVSRNPASVKRRAEPRAYPPVPPRPPPLCGTRRLATLGVEPFGHRRRRSREVTASSGLLASM